MRISSFLLRKLRIFRLWKIDINNVNYVCKTDCRNHCEMNFLNKIKKLAIKKKWDIVKTARIYYPKIFLLNFTSEGELRNSKPCAICHKLILELGIKINYYENGSWKENITNQIENTSLSSYYKNKKRIYGNPFV